MDINQMRYFIETCRQGSLSNAAKALHMSQQGLSLSIKRLEDELNCDLFYRKPSGLVLTDYGKFFKTEAESIIKHVDNIIEYCDNRFSGKAKLSVACTMNIIVHLPKTVQRLLVFGSDEMDVNSFEDWTIDCETKVLEDEVNFGIVYGPCETTKFDVKTLDVLQQVFIVSKEHPLASLNEISLKDLEDIPLIVPHQRCRPGRKIRNMFENAGVNLNIAYTCDRPRQTIDLIKSNPQLAARIILEDVTEADKEFIKVLKLKDDDFLLPICLISKKEKRLSIPEKFFRHEVIDSFQGADSK